MTALPSNNIWNNPTEFKIRRRCETGSISGASLTGSVIEIHEPNLFVRAILRFVREPVHLMRLYVYVAYYKDGVYSFVFCHYWYFNSSFPHIFQGTLSFYKYYVYSIHYQMNITLYTVYYMYTTVYIGTVSVLIWPKPTT